MFNITKIKAAMLQRLAVLVVIGLLSILLAACQTYNGYPTTTPVPTDPPTQTVAPVAAPRPTLPPPPTFTPRPALPATPAGVQLKNSNLLKEGFDALLNNYFQKLNTGDIYEVGLQSIRTGLEQNGIQNPEVPIPNFTDKDDANWNAFLQAYTLVADKYKGQVTEDDLTKMVLSGTASSLQDCQTTYVPSTQANNFLTLRLGQFATVGLGINLQSGQTSSGANAHFISRVVPGSPADRAGLKIGDQITSVDGQDATTKTPTEVIQLLRGNNATAGSKLLITYRRGGGTDQGVEITRANVQQAPIERQTLPEGLGYLRFNSFPLMGQQDLDNYSKTLDSWMADFAKANVTGFILDLRGNQYGSIRAVQTALSRFVSGSELVYLSGMEPAGQNNQNSAPKYGSFGMPSVPNVKPTDKPLVVLVDGGTAAEAEIFALAIQKAKRGTIVGGPTAGCVVASTPVNLKDQSLMNVTIYRAITDPQKADSVVENIQPEQNATMDLQALSQGIDSQLEAAKKVLKK